jgi:hypothetical protein
VVVGVALATTQKYNWYRREQRLKEILHIEFERDKKLPRTKQDIKNYDGKSTIWCVGLVKLFSRPKSACQKAMEELR